MIVEQRIYTLQVGKTAEFCAYYGAHGLPIQTRILGTLLGSFVSDIGKLNQFIQLWGYESLADRETRRVAMSRDPEWLAYLKKQPALLVDQENRILIPTDFSPIR